MKTFHPLPRPQARLYAKFFFKYQNTRRQDVNLWMSTEALSQNPKVCSPPMYLSIGKKERKEDDELNQKLLIFFFHKNWSSYDFPTPENGIILKGSRHRHALRERAFTSVVVVEITEVSGAGDGDHLSDSGRRPTRDGVPHALAACKPSRGDNYTASLKPAGVAHTCSTATGTKRHSI